VEHLVAADAHSVAVAGDDPHGEIRPRGLDARGDGGRAAVDVAPAVPIPAAATAATTVKVGKFIKKTSGVLTKLEGGDIACYLSLKGDDGKSFEEMGDFSICEKQTSLVGKRVALSYELGTVVSDECGGDENCKKTKTVALVTAVKAMGK